MILDAKTPVFLDTNILLRYDILETPEHQQVRQAVRTLIAWDCILWISRQVIREYCRALTHPAFSHPLEMPQAVKRARLLVPFFHIADENERVTKSLFELMEAVEIGGKQVHDANLEDCARFSQHVSLLTLEQVTPDAE